MAQCHNPESYDRTNQKNKHGFATPAATKERRALKKAARKFSRACEKLLIECQLQDMTEMKPAQPVVDLQQREIDAMVVEIRCLASEVNWGVTDIIELYDTYGHIPAEVIWECHEDYKDFMDGVEFYQ